MTNLQTNQSNNFSADDHTFMAEAIRLARRGLYTTEPNPRVGCVLVVDGKIVGRGWHQKAGQGHAEVNAIKEAGDKAKGATAYVSLEPCSHFGKTPPCAEGLIRARVSRVVAAMLDPNPLVSGKGFALLEAAGIAVEYGLLEGQARELNPGFIRRMETGRPFIRIKMAMSVDGRTAMQSGESQWITGPDARSDVQRLRARSSAIITGVGTIRHDNAALTLREHELGLANASEVVLRQPLRVVLDTRGSLLGDEKVFCQSGQVLYFLTNDNAPAAAIENNSQVDIIRLSGKYDRNYGLDEVLSVLAARDCNEVLVEAGAALAGSFIAQNCWDELVIYMAPKLMGSDARPLVELPISKMAQARSLVLKDVVMVGRDIRLTYSPDKKSGS